MVVANQIILREMQTLNRIMAEAIASASILSQSDDTR